MTTRTKRTAKPRPIEALIGGDRELLKGLVKEALQEVLEAAMTEALGAGLGERTADRTGYRSGYYSRGLVTRIGKLELRVPRDREGRFSTPGSRAGKPAIPSSPTGSRRTSARR